MRTAEQVNATQQALNAQLTAAALTEPMRRAILAAQAAPAEPEWDQPADYCQGHESLRGDLMGASDYCESWQVCEQAREAYEADHAPDPDRLAILAGKPHQIGTIVALIHRGLCSTLMYAEANYFELTDLGVQVFEVLKAAEVAK